MRAPIEQSNRAPNPQGSLGIAGGTGSGGIGYAGGYSGGRPWTRQDLVNYMQATGTNNPDAAATALNQIYNQGQGDTSSGGTNSGGPTINGTPTDNSGFFGSSTAADRLSPGGGGGGGGGGTQGSGGNNAGGLFNPGNIPSQNGTSSGINFQPFPQFNPIGTQSPGNGSGGINGGTYYPSGEGPNGPGGSVSPSDNGFYNTPGYQMMFGNQAYQNFHNDPGYQYSVDQAMRNVQRNAASKGLLESGSVMREMTDRAQNMANQQYGDWWNRQAQQYGDYQNRLAGLAGGPTGSDQAFQLGTNLGNNSANMGSNLASLFGNQGNAGLGAIINTGAAQANALGQAANTQAQINSANNSTLLAGALLGQQQRQPPTGR